MSHKLCIDIGNTLQKVAVFSEKGDIVAWDEQPDFPIQKLENLVCHYHITSSILSSVATERTDIEDFLEKRTRYTRFTHDTPLPIQISYKQPETLGLDRIANAVAAHSYFPTQNVLSIQCGTCLVMDFVTADGHYLGGSIAPGLEMRLAALQHYTQRLPKIEKRPINFYIGDTTEKSILSGVINGMCDEINGAIQRYQDDFGEIKIMMTGGNCSDLQNSIKYSIFAAANVVLYGLYKILKFNDKGEP